MWCAYFKHIFFKFRWPQNLCACVYKTLVYIPQSWCYIECTFRNAGREILLTFIIWLFDSRYFISYGYFHFHYTCLGQIHEHIFGFFFFFTILLKWNWHTINHTYFKYTIKFRPLCFPMRPTPQSRWWMYPPWKTWAFLM